MKSAQKPVGPCEKPDMELIGALRTIRHALLIGLESFGEIERLINRYPTSPASLALLGEGNRPIHPTGGADTVGVFATALRTLESLEPDIL